MLKQPQEYGLSIWQFAHETHRADHCWDCRMFLSPTKSTTSKQQSFTVPFFLHKTPSWISPWWCIGVPTATSTELSGISYVQLVNLWWTVPHLAKPSHHPCLIAVNPIYRKSKANKPETIDLGFFLPHNIICFCFSHPQRDFNWLNNTSWHKASKYISDCCILLLSFKLP